MQRQPTEIQTRKPRSRLEPSETEEGVASKRKRTANAASRRRRGKRRRMAGKLKKSASIFVTRAQAVEISSLSLSALDRMRAHGDGPPFVKIRRSIRYDRKKLLDWMHEHEVRSTSEYPEKP